MNQASMAPQALTMVEVCERLRTERKTVKRLIASGQLPAYKIGTVWRVDAPDLESFIAARKAAARAAHQGRRS